MIKNNRVEIMTSLERGVMLHHLLGVILSDGTSISKSTVTNGKSGAETEKFVCMHPHFVNEERDKTMFYFDEGGFHDEVVEHNPRAEIGPDRYLEREWTAFEKDFWDVILRKEIVRLRKTLELLENYDSKWSA